MSTDIMARRYKLAGPNFAHEIIDGEAVIVNLEKGSYYSLDHVGARIWDLLNAGISDQEILAELLETYSGPASEIEAGLKDLVDEFEHEGILAVDLDSAGQVDLSPAPPVEGKPTFVKPALEKYTDMEAILMLDPIHEVDVAGWPNAKPES